MNISVDKKLISFWKEQAQKEIPPELGDTFAGTSLSVGGGIKMIEILNSIYADFEVEADRLPETFSSDISPDLLAKVDSLALMYLFADRFRPTLGIKILPRSRAVKREFHSYMDHRAMIAAVRLNQIRSILDRFDK